MRSICYLLPFPMIHWTTLFKIIALTYLKTIGPLFQIWSTKSKDTAGFEAFSQRAGLAIKDKEN